ncbi:MAG: hypothetical protein AAGJ79_07525 [Verrucomicrobiota bacterium]
MKKLSENKLFFPVILAAVVFSAILLRDITAQDGSPGALNPTAAPAPTMNTLGDIFNAVDGSPGGNFGALFQNNVYAFDATASPPAWVGPQSISGGAASTSRIVESNGNIAANGTTSAAAWSPANGWAGLTGISSPQELLGSNGNFLLRTSAQAFVWNKATGTWTEFPDQGNTDSAIGSNGSFCVMWTNNVAVAWTPGDGFVVQVGGSNRGGLAGADPVEVTAP